MYIWLKQEIHLAVLLLWDTEGYLLTQRNLEEPN